MPGPIAGKSNGMPLSTRNEMIFAACWASSTDWARNTPAHFARLCPSKYSEIP